MEKGIARLVEVANAVAQINQEGYDLMRVEATPEGVRLSVVFQIDQQYYSQENTTPWSAVHPRPDTKNPLIGALDMLVKARLEFKP